MCPPVPAEVPRSRVPQAQAAPAIALIANTQLFRGEIPSSGLVKASISAKVLAQKKKTLFCCSSQRPNGLPPPVMAECERYREYETEMCTSGKKTAEHDASFPREHEDCSPSLFLSCALVGIYGTSVPMYPQKPAETRCCSPLMGLSQMAGETTRWVPVDLTDRNQRVSPQSAFLV